MLCCPSVLPKIFGAWRRVRAVWSFLRVVTILSVGSEVVFSIPKADAWGLMKQNVYCKVRELLLQNSTNYLTSIGQGVNLAGADCPECTPL